jgi:hypothetical protein
MPSTQTANPNHNQPEDHQDRQEEKHFNREHKRWAIIVSVITALSGFVIATARVIEAISAASVC